MTTKTRAKTKAKSDDIPSELAIMAFMICGMKEDRRNAQSLSIKGQDEIEESLSAGIGILEDSFRRGYSSWQSQL